MLFSENYKVWLKNSKSNKEENKFLLNLTKSQKERLFSKIINCGKAGLRKKIGYGSDQFNLKTIKQLILSFVEVFSKKKELRKYKFIVLHDARKFSLEVSRMIANVLTSFGLKVILNTKNEVAPIPYLSYLITNKFKAFGFMVTASHQEKEYNGCKIFSSKGHIISSDDVTLINNLIIKKNHEFLLKKIIDKKENIEYLSKEQKEEYFNEIINKISLNDNSLSSRPKILYSSNHGAGFKWVDELLKKAKYDVDIVKEQCNYDSEFSTLKDPNPENDSSFDFSIKKALEYEKKPELIIINDSDVDRMRVAVWNGNEYEMLVGNQIAAIFIYFFLKELKLKGSIFMTFVSTNLIYKIAQDFKCKVEKTMTGFYNLAEKYLKEDLKTFLFAFEESLGFLPYRSLSNDKDGLQSSLLISEITSYLKYKKNINLLEYLDQISEKYGYFDYRQLRIKLVEKTQVEKIIKIIKSLKKLNNIPIKKIVTYFGENLDNLHQIFFDDGSWVGCRPSVTEPVFKFYFVSCSNSKKRSKIIVEELKKNWENLIFQ